MPRAVLHGSRDTIRRITLDNESLSELLTWRRAPSVTMRIELQGTPIEHWRVFGSASVHLQGGAQPTLQLEVSGSGEISATWTADVVSARIAGSGNIDVGVLKQKHVRVNIDGSGKAVIEPVENADLSITGNGGITMLKAPIRIRYTIFGSGWIRGPADDVR